MAASVVTWSDVLSQIRLLLSDNDTTGYNADERIEAAAELAHQDIWRAILGSPNWRVLMSTSVLMTYTEGGVGLVDLQGTGIGGGPERVERLVRVLECDSSGNVIGWIPEIGPEYADVFVAESATPEGLYSDVRYWLSNTGTVGLSLHFTPETPGYFKVLYIPPLEPLTDTGNPLFNDNVFLLDVFRLALVYGTLRILGRRHQDRSAIQWEEDYNRTLLSSIDSLSTAAQVNAPSEMLNGWGA